MSSTGRIGVALVVALLGSACSATRTAPSVTMPPPSRHVLPNGVRVVVQEHRASEVVALQLWVRAGGRDETDADLGLAHYLEHMLFKGTIQRPPGFMDREVEGVGGRMNAGTSLDYTYYHMVLPARRALGGIETLADMSVNATLDETALGREKGVVLEEMRRHDDSPRRFLMQRVFGAVFEGHPYGRPVIGSPGHIRQLTRERLRTFYRRHYDPEAFTLVVVGAVSPAEVLAAAARSFGRLPRGGADRLPVRPPTPLRPARIDLPRPGASSYLALAWLGPRIDHADAAAVELLVSILGQTRSSRLTQALRERRGLVESISSGYVAMEAVGLITVTAQLRSGSLADAEREILREIERLRASEVAEAERARAVTLAEAHREFLMETAEGLAWVFGRAETLWRLEDDLAWVDRLRSVTREQIRTVARRYLDPERHVRVALLGTAR